jgi:hypothetical protein
MDVEVFAKLRQAKRVYLDLDGDGAIDVQLAVGDGPDQVWQIKYWPSDRVSYSIDLPVAVDRAEKVDIRAEVQAESKESRAEIVRGFKDTGRLLK